MKLLKLGGSVITNKKGRCEANLQNIEKLAKMLGKLWAKGVRDIVLVHGAGSFGHALVIEKNLRGKLEREQYADALKVQKECENLSGILIEKLRENKVDVVRIAPHEIIEAKAGRIAKIGKQKVLDVLKSGKWPVLHGDMVRDFEFGYVACSGDQIIAKFAPEAQFVVLGTDVDGIIVDGKVVGKIDKGNFDEIAGHIKESDSPDVTGGMLGKISEMREAGGKYFVVNAKYPQRIEALLLGKKAKCTKLEF